MFKLSPHDKQIGVHSMEEDSQLCHISQVGSLIHSKKVCNKIFSLFSQLCFQISGYLIYPINDHISANTHINKQLLHTHHTFSSYNPFTNSSPVNGWTDFVISSATIKFASLCDFALVKKVCCNKGFLFNASTFYYFCSAMRYLYLSWHFIS